jgi:hypothetical protein
VYLTDAEAEVSARMSSHIHGEGDVVYNELNFEYIISQRLRFQKLPFQLDPTPFICF